MKKWMIVWLTALSLMVGMALAEGDITSKAALNAQGMKVGVAQGSVAEQVVREQLPEAEMVYFNDNATAFLAVAQGKVDAYVYDYNQMRIAIEGGVPGVHLLSETLGEPVQIAVGISPATKIAALEDKLNRFVSELRADGMLDDMFTRWVGDGSDEMPEIALPENPEIHLTVGTSGIVPPFSYYKGTELAGYDIELARRFAAWLGADLQFKVYDYGAIIPAAASGDVDCVMANLNITPERREALTFSDPLYEERLGVMVKGDASAMGDVPVAANVVDEAAPAYAAYNGKRIGVLTGPLMEDVAHEVFPDSEYLLFNSYPDCITALLTGKIDAYLGDEPGLKTVHAEQTQIDYIHERITENNYSFAFRKNDPESAALCEELNEFLAKSWADGTMQELDDIWFGVDEDRKVVEMSDLTGENGTIKVVTTSTDAPFSYIKDGRNVGYDIDLVVRFCRDRGYALELGDVDFASRIPAIESGKYDFTTDMNVTPEREEEVLFSDPTSKGGIVLAVRKAGMTARTAAAGDDASFSDLSGKTVSMLTGAPFEELVRGKAPDVGAFSSFNNMPDMVLALKSGKTDAFLINNAIATLAVNRDLELALFPQNLQDGTFGFAFAKGDSRRDAWQAAFDAIPQEAIEAVWDKWTGTDESVKILPEQDWPGANGTVRVAACDTLEPMSYMGGDGELKGFDLEVILMIARGMDVRVEFTGMEFSAILSSVQSGKADIGAGSIIITEERAQAVDFVEYYPAAFVLIVRAKQAEVASLAPSDFNGKRAGVITGSFHDSVIAEELPDSPISQYNNYTDMVAALKADKIDYFLASTEVAGSLMEADGALTALAEPIRVLDIGAMFAKTEKGDALRTQMDAYIEKIKADGTLDEIYAFWSDPANESKPVDMSGLTGENGTLQFATSGTKVPISFVANGQIAGTDPDIAARFCREYGYGIEVNIVDTAGIIPGIVTGMYDFSLSDMVVTDERKESVNFSVPYHGTELLVLTRSEAATDAQVASDGQAGGLSAFADSFNKTFIREGRWKLFLDGVLTTLLITLLTILFGTLLGFGVFMLCRNGNPVANLVTRFCLWLVQGMPMVVLLMILYYIIFGSVAISGIAVAVIGFTLTFGAAVFGLLKMGVGAVDDGQYEAAYALGYSGRRTFFKIILPQALPHVLPAYKGEIVGLIKATAIVGYIAVQDLTKMGDIVRSRTYEAFFPLIAVTVIYFVLEGLIGFLVSRISVSFNPKRRKPADILRGVKTDD